MIIIQENIFRKKKPVAFAMSIIPCRKIFSQYPLSQKGLTCFTLTKDIHPSEI
jgi:hypothetical protein